MGKMKTSNENVAEKEQYLNKSQNKSETEIGSFALYNCRKNISVLGYYHVSSQEGGEPSTEDGKHCKTQS